MPSGPKKRKAAKKKKLLKPINVQGVNGGGDDDLLSHDDKSENGDVGSPKSVEICSDQCLVEEKDSSGSMDTGKKIEIRGSENGDGESVQHDGEGFRVSVRDVEVKEEEGGNLTSIKPGFEGKIIRVDSNEVIRLVEISSERELEKTVSSSSVIDRSERVVSSSEEVNRVAEALVESPGVHLPAEENEVEMLPASDSLSGKIGESRSVEIKWDGELEKPMSEILVMDPPVDWSEQVQVVSLLEEGDRVVEPLVESSGILDVVHFPSEENGVEMLLLSDSLSGKIGESRSVEIKWEGELEKPVSEVLVMDPPVDWSEQVVSLLEEGDRVVEALVESPGVLGVVHFPREENEVEMLPSSDSLSGQIGEFQSVEITPQMELEKPESKILVMGPPVDRPERVVSLMEEGIQVIEASGESYGILGIVNLLSEDYEEKMLLSLDPQSGKTGESQSVEVTSERELEEPISSNLTTDPPVDLFEPIVSVSEEVIRATEASGESPGVLGVVNLPSEDSEEDLHPSSEILRGKSGDGSEFCKGSCNLESSENMERKPLVKSIRNPTSWKSCCGLFDVLMGGHR